MMTITIAAAAVCAAAVVLRARAESGLSHTGIAGGFQGRTVPAAYARDAQIARGKGLDVAPTTGVASPHLMAPPG